MNSIFVIHPYKYKGMWVFDDEEKGLVKEPFVAGADVIIDNMAKRIPSAESGFNLIFSSQMFPHYDLALYHIEEEHGGNVYYAPDLNLKGWLCPALLKYFKFAPKEIYAQFKEAKCK